MSKAIKRMDDDEFMAWAQSQIDKNPNMRMSTFIRKCLKRGGRVPFLTFTPTPEMMDFESKHGPLPALQIPDDGSSLPLRVSKFFKRLFGPTP